ncbi:hypothetical protein GS458_2753 [Geobacillus stearothermophilus]|nr:hypothetical protein GS458_2753 [Geobacillus stearothermophilus]
MQIKNISLDELPSGVREVADRALAEWKVRLPVRELARMLNRTIPSIRNQIELLRRKGLI